MKLITKGKRQSTGLNNEWEFRIYSFSSDTELPKYYVYDLICKEVLHLNCILVVRGLLINDTY